MSQIIDVNPECNYLGGVQIHQTLETNREGDQRKLLLDKKVCEKCCSDITKTRPYEGPTKMELGLMFGFIIFIIGFALYLPMMVSF